MILATTPCLSSPGCENARWRVFRLDRLLILVTGKVVQDPSMPIQSSDLIEVKRITGKGRGVFAREFIPEGTVFERTPVLVIPTEEVMESGDEPVLADYVFDWGRGTVALALGFGSLYNHSYRPNARYDDEGQLTKIFTALRDISPGEEITVNYNGHEDDSSPVGFEVMEHDGAARDSFLSLS